jgi:Tol biopolymer transport system component
MFAVLAALIAALTVSVRTDVILRASIDEINTTGYEDSPFLSPDGKSLYFMYTPWSTWPVVFWGGSPVLLGPERPGHHINPEDNPWEDADLYVSTKASNGTWSTPRNLGFNDDQADCCAMTWNGSTFAYQRTQRPQGGLTDIYFMQSSGNKWIRTSAGTGVNGLTSSESNAHLSSDGTTLYFTSDRAGGYGKHDLYVSYKRTDGTWGPAANMGPKFNTAAFEDQVWVSRDGKTMYFNRELDIMTSKRVNGAWTTPALVKFGGVWVPGAEVSVTDDGSTMVFAEVRPEVEDIVIVSSKLQSNGTWGPTAPIYAK